MAEQRSELKNQITWINRVSHAGQSIDLLL
jgi:hypothetical protein